MLYSSVLESHPLSLVKNLMTEPALKDMRLGSTTALALQYGCIKPLMSCFYGKLTSGESYGGLSGMLNEYGDCKILNRTEKSGFYLVYSDAFYFKEYDLPWLDEPIIEDGIRLASPRDIAVMEINSIIAYPYRETFVNIYFLLQHYSLPELLSFYTHANPDVTIAQVLTSLMRINETERSSMPEILQDNITWDDIAAFIKRSADEYAASL